MAWFDSVDWHAVFVPTVPLLEILIRGSAIYLALFLMFRFLLKRQAGTVSMTDLLVVVLVADASQNAMAADYKSVPDGIVLVATILFWSYAIDWLGQHFPAVGRLVHPPPLELIRDGRLNRKNMRQELITLDELMSQLREQGIAEVREVERACMEGNGHISVVKKDHEPHGKKKDPAT